MKILGIETSCDETAVALIEDGQNILTDIVASQISLHSKYGGVVPEIASRKHVEAILPVLEEALAKSGQTLKDVEAIAVTQGPGLVGSLLTGIAVAKSLAYVLDIPWVGVNHIYSHIEAIFLSPAYPQSFPFIALVISGGHTVLFRVEDHNHMKLLGRTRDDAAGEAFDKVAKFLGLGYPGGVIIDRLAKQGDPQAINFPRPLLEDDSFDFSFSGLKTAVLQYVRQLNKELSPAQIRAIAASFQEAVVDTLLAKTMRAAKCHKLSQVVIVGGVACNSRLREKFWQEGQEKEISVFFPPPRLCTDNAAMVAAAGYHLLVKGQRATLDLNAFSRLIQDPAHFSGCRG
ncbi:MAG: tRNA (adenosine(37)-N6)-threonylcarbamoyltransferase complex transferase subunit TsaD [Thermodesulfobacteriota bacterium]